MKLLNIYFHMNTRNHKRELSSISFSFTYKLLWGNHYVRKVCLLFKRIVVVVVVAQSLSHFQLFVTPWTVAHQALLFSIVSQRWLKFMSIGSVMLSSHPLLPSSFPFNLFSIRVFSSESVLYIRWPRYWSFSLSISLSNEYSGLISFRVDSSDLPAIQGTLKSLLQDHNLKASILWCLAFFMVQLSHPHGTTGKIIVLTTCIFFSFV